MSVTTTHHITVYFDYPPHDPIFQNPDWSDRIETAVFDLFRDLPGDFGHMCMDTGGPAHGPSVEAQCASLFDAIYANDKLKQLLEAYGCTLQEEA